MPRTLFVSDCHLDVSRPHIVKCFERFLKTEAAAADALYILGDLFDCWIGDDDMDHGLDTVIEALRKLSETTSVYLMHGNRDFLIGHGFTQKTGCTLLEQPRVIDLHGRRTLIMHGDVLCSDDRNYQLYRKILQNPVSRRIIYRLKPGTRRKIALKLRQSSKKSIKKKDAKIMDANETTVVRYMEHFMADQLIHGHTHKPAVHTVRMKRRAGKRIVLSDWYNRGSYLLVEGDTAKNLNLTTESIATVPS